MAEANLHESRASANAFANFDMLSLDQLHADLDVLKTLINVAIDNMPAGIGDTPETLLHAALHQLKRADDRHRSIHDALLDIQHGKGAQA